MSRPRVGFFMHIERTFDVDLVNRIISHPSIYPFVSDDGAPDAVKFDCLSMIDNHACYFLAPLIDNNVAGIFFYHPHNSITYEVHTNILPEYRGSMVVDMAIASLEWMFSGTSCKKVITHVPENNRAAYRLAKKVGMKNEGINRASFMKGGNIMDQHLLGIVKGELLCQQQQ